MAYDRVTLDRFFSHARDERDRLTARLDEARRRIAHAKAALAASSGTEHASVHAVLEAQRHLREERRANERAIAAIYADAEAQVEQARRNVGRS